MTIKNGTKRGANRLGNLLNLGLVDVKDSSDDISGQTKDYQEKERVSNVSRKRFRAIREKMRYAHRWALRSEENDEISQMREHAETSMVGRTDTWLERRVRGAGNGDEGESLTLHLERSL